MKKILFTILLGIFLISQALAITDITDLKINTTGEIYAEDYFVNGDFCIVGGNCLTDYLTSYTETDPKWSANYSNFLTISSWNDTGLIINWSKAINYSQINVNNSQFLQGLTPTDIINSIDLSNYLLNTGDTATGDYAFDTDTLFIDSTTHKIGIGTTSPIQNLHIEETKSTNMGAYIYNPSTSSAARAQIYLRSSNAGLLISASSYYGAGYVQALSGEKLILGANYGTGMTFDTNNKVGIGTTTPTYTLTVGNQSNTDYSLISIYAEGNISAGGYITRTSIYDKSVGNALDKIQDATYYLKEGKVDDSQFYGYTTWTTYEDDLTKPIIKYVEEEECGESCEIKLVQEITYEQKPILNEGVLLDKEIDLLRQSIYELKVENELLKLRLTNAGIK